MLVLSLLALASTALATTWPTAMAEVSCTTTAETAEVETLYIVEYTEVCLCPATPTITVPAITTMTCCDTCAPITITETAQPVTSCTTGFTTTTAMCQTPGVYLLGGTLYPCNSPPCAIEYQAPCPTCYVCPYSQCWVPNSSPRCVQVYEYFGSYENEVGCWEEEWTPTVFHPCISVLILDLATTLCHDQILPGTYNFH